MKTLFCLAAFSIAILTTRAQGSLEAMQGYVNPTTDIFSPITTGHPMTLGWIFQPQTDISVTALGAFNDVLHGSGNMEIGLWNSTGDLLISTLVALTGTSTGSIYQSTAPVLLTADQTYYLGAYSSSPVYFYVVGPDTDTDGYAIMSPEIQLNGIAFNTNNAFAFPSSIEGQPGDAVVMPNFQFEAVPEPSTLCFFGGGMAGWFLIRRKVKSPATAV
jgi:hypothetical protein